MIRFFNFPVLPSCMLALEPCRVHICCKDIITELDNGFQQNTRHTGRPSRHPRSIPMRRMSQNWAHRHRPPASHALTGGASVADVLPEGRLPRGDTSAHRTQSAVPPWRMFCQKGRLPRGKHFRPPLPACRASWKMFCRKGRLARGGTSGSVSGKVTSRQGLRFRFGKCHEESTSAHHATQQMFCLKAIEGKGTRGAPIPPPTTKHQPQTKQRLEL